jgi:hypothetical protein
MLLKQHLALRKDYEAKLSGEGHRLGRWNGVRTDKHAYCQSCRGRIRIYTTPRSNPNTAGGEIFSAADVRLIFVGEGSLLPVRACEKPW